MKFAYAVLLGVMVLAHPSFAADKARKTWTAAECQAERTKLNELQDADLATIGIDEEERQKRVHAKLLEISKKCPTAPH